MNKKMADIDIDSFGEHELRPEEPMDERISLDPVTPGRSNWDPWGPGPFTCGVLHAFGPMGTGT